MAKCRCLWLMGSEGGEGLRAGRTPHRAWVSLWAALMVALKGFSLWLGSGLHPCLSLPASLGPG